MYRKKTKKANNKKTKNKKGDHKKGEEKQTSAFARNISMR